MNNFSSTINSWLFRERQARYGQKEYYDELFDLIKERIKKVYSKLPAMDIFYLLRDRKVVIMNPELFYNEQYHVQDPSYRDSSAPLTSLEVYLKEVLRDTRKLLAEGVSYVPLLFLPIQLARIIKVYKCSCIHEVLSFFLLSLFSYNSYEKNPINIQILDELLLQKVEINPSKYYKVCNSIIEAYKNVVDTKDFGDVNIELLHSVSNNAKSKQTNYLAKGFNISYNEVSKVLNKETLLDSEAQISVVLDFLTAKYGKSEVPIRSIVRELKKISESELVLCTPSKVSSEVISSCNNLPLVKDSYIYADIPINPEAKIFSEVYVDYSKHSDIDDLLHSIDIAFKLNMFKFEEHIAINPAFKKENPVFKITLVNVSDIDTEYIKSLVKELQLKKSCCNKEVIFEVRFSSSAISKLKPSLPKDIKIISDVHSDVNESKNYNIDLGDYFIINCGDTSGDCVSTANWMSSHVQHGVFVHGNHLGYNHPFDSMEQNTQDYQMQYLREKFPVQSNVAYLNNNVYIFNGIVILGCCLYSNFELEGEERVLKSTTAAYYGMNDFSHVRVNDNGFIRRITPEDYIKRFNESKEFLEMNLKKHKNKPVIIVTHFAPTPYSISKTYEGSPLNAAFANDMREFISKYNNIRMWAHGHIHECMSYVYKNTLVVANPFGYYNENNVDVSKYGFVVDSELLKNKEAWEEYIRKEFEVYES